MTLCHRAPSLAAQFTLCQKEHLFGVGKHAGLNFSMLLVDKAKVGIIGLGYVGLPLAIEFGKVMSTVGFDINANRIYELRSGKDSTLEVDAAELA